MAVQANLKEFDDLKHLQLAIAPWEFQSMPGTKASQWPEGLPEFLARLEKMAPLSFWNEPLDTMPYGIQFIKNLITFINTQIDKLQEIEINSEQCEGSRNNLGIAIRVLFAMAVQMGSSDLLVEGLSTLTQLEKKCKIEDHQAIYESIKENLRINLQQIQDNFMQKNNLRYMDITKTSGLFSIAQFVSFAQQTEQNTSIATDGDYLYIYYAAPQNGLMMKVGTGASQKTIAGKVYLEKKHDRESEVSWVYCGGKLFARRLKDELGMVTLYDVETFNSLGEAKLVARDLFGTKSNVNRSQPFLTDGNNKLFIITMKVINKNKVVKPEMIQRHQKVQEDRKNNDSLPLKFQNEIEIAENLAASERAQIERLEAELKNERIRKIERMHAEMISKEKEEELLKIKFGLKGRDQKRPRRAGGRDAPRGREEQARGGARENARPTGRNEDQKDTRNEDRSQYKICQFYLHEFSTISEDPSIFVSDLSGDTDSSIQNDLIEEMCQAFGGFFQPQECEMALRDNNMDMCEAAFSLACKTQENNYQMTLPLKRSVLLCESLVVQEPILKKGQPPSSQDIDIQVDEDSVLNPQCLVKGKWILNGTTLAYHQNIMQENTLIHLFSTDDTQMRPVKLEKNLSVQAKTYQPVLSSTKGTAHSTSVISLHQKIFAESLDPSASLFQQAELAEKRDLFSKMLLQSEELDDLDIPPPEFFSKELGAMNELIIKDLEMVQSDVARIANQVNLSKKIEQPSLSQQKSVYIPKCRSNHFLRSLTVQPPYYKGSVRCDECKTNDIQTQGQFHHCEQCRYDLCKKCHADQVNQVEIQIEDSYLYEEVQLQGTHLQTLRSQEGLLQSSKGAITYDPLYKKYYVMILANQSNRYIAVISDLQNFSDNFEKNLVKNQLEILDEKSSDIQSIIDLNLRKKAISSEDDLIGTIDQFQSVCMQILCFIEKDRFNMPSRWNHWSRLYQLALESKNLKDSELISYLNKNAPEKLSLKYFNAFEKEQNNPDGFILDQRGIQNKGQEQEESSKTRTRQIQKLEARLQKVLVAEAELLRDKYDFKHDPMEVKNLNEMIYKSQKIKQVASVAPEPEKPKQTEERSPVREMTRQNLKSIYERAKSFLKTSEHQPNSAFSETINFSELQLPTLQKKVQNPIENRFTFEKEIFSENQKFVMPLENKVVHKEYKLIYQFCSTGSIDTLRSLFYILQNINEKDWKLRINLLQLMVIWTVHGAEISAEFKSDRNLLNQVSNYLIKTISGLNEVRLQNVKQQQERERILQLKKESELCWHMLIIGWHFFCRSTDKQNEIFNLILDDTELVKTEQGVKQSDPQSIEIASTETTTLMYIHGEKTHSQYFDPFKSHLQKLGLVSKPSTEEIFQRESVQTYYTQLLGSCFFDAAWKDFSAMNLFRLKFFEQEGAFYELQVLNRNIVKSYAVCLHLPVYKKVIEYIQKELQDKALESNKKILQIINRSILDKPLDMCFQSYKTVPISLKAIETQFKIKKSHLQAGFHEIKQDNFLPNSKQEFSKFRPQPLGDQVQTQQTKKGKGFKKGNDEDNQLITVMGFTLEELNLSTQVRSKGEKILSLNNGNPFEQEIFSNRAFYSRKYHNIHSRLFCMPIGAILNESTQSIKGLTMKQMKQVFTSRQFQTIKKEEDAKIQEDNLFILIKELKRVAQMFQAEPNIVGDDLVTINSQIQKLENDHKKRAVELADSFIQKIQQAFFSETSEKQYLQNLVTVFSKLVQNANILSLSYGKSCSMDEQLNLIYKVQKLAISLIENDIKMFSDSKISHIRIIEISPLINVIVEVLSLGLMDENIYFPAIGYKMLPGLCQVIHLIKQCFKVIEVSSQAVVQKEQIPEIEGAKQKEIKQDQSQLNMLESMQALTNEGIDFARERIFETPHPYPQNDYQQSETIEVQKAIGFIVELDRKSTAEHSTDQLVIYSGSDHVYSINTNFCSQIKFSQKPNTNQPYFLIGNRIKIDFRSYSQRQRKNNHGSQFNPAQPANVEGGQRKAAAQKLNDPRWGFKIIVRPIFSEPQNIVLSSHVRVTHRKMIYTQLGGETNSQFIEILLNQIVCLACQFSKEMSSVQKFLWLPDSKLTSTENDSQITQIAPKQVSNKNILKLAKQQLFRGGVHNLNFLLEKSTQIQQKVQSPELQQVRRNSLDIDYNQIIKNELYAWQENISQNYNYFLKQFYFKNQKENCQDENFEQQQKLNSFEPLTELWPLLLKDYVTIDFQLQKQGSFRLTFSQAIEKLYTKMRDLVKVKPVVTQEFMRISAKKHRGEWLDLEKLMIIVLLHHSKSLHLIPRFANLKIPNVRSSAGAFVGSKGFQGQSGYPNSTEETLFLIEQLKLLAMQVDDLLGWLIQRVKGEINVQSQMSTALAIAQQILDAKLEQKRKEAEMIEQQKREEAEREAKEKADREAKEKAEQESMQIVEQAEVQDQQKDKKLQQQKKPEAILVTGNKTVHKKRKNVVKKALDLSKTIKSVKKGAQLEKIEEKQIENSQNKQDEKQEEEQIKEVVVSKWAELSLGEIQEIKNQIEIQFYEQLAKEYLGPGADFSVIKHICLIFGLKINQEDPGETVKQVFKRLKVRLAPIINLDDSFQTQIPIKFPSLRVSESHEEKESEIYAVESPYVQVIRDVRNRLLLLLEVQPSIEYLNNVTKLKEGKCFSRYGSIRFSTRGGMITPSASLSIRKYGTQENKFKKDNLSQSERSQSQHFINQSHQSSGQRIDENQQSEKIKQSIDEDNSQHDDEHYDKLAIDINNIEINKIDEEEDDEEGDELMPLPIERSKSQQVTIQQSKLGKTNQKGQVKGYTNPNMQPKLIKNSSLGLGSGSQADRASQMSLGEESNVDWNNLNKKWKQWNRYHSLQGSGGISDDKDLTSPFCSPLLSVLMFAKNSEISDLDGVRQMFSEQTKRAAFRIFSMKYQSKLYEFMHSTPYHRFLWGSISQPQQKSILEQVEICGEHLVNQLNDRAKKSAKQHMDFLVIQSDNLRHYQEILEQVLKQQQENKPSTQVPGQKSENVSDQLKRSKEDQIKKTKAQSGKNETKKVQQEQNNDRRVKTITFDEFVPWQMKTIMQSLNDLRVLLSDQFTLMFVLESFNNESKEIDEANKDNNETNISFDSLRHYIQSIVSVMLLSHISSSFSEQFPNSARLSSCAYKAAKNVLTLLVCDKNQVREAETSKALQEIMLQILVDHLQKVTNFDGSNLVVQRNDLKPKIINEKNLDEIVLLLKLMQEVMLVSSDTQFTLNNYQQVMIGDQKAQANESLKGGASGQEITQNSQFLTPGSTNVMKCARLLSYLMTDFEVPVVVRQAIRCARLFFFGLVNFKNLNFTKESIELSNCQLAQKCQNEFLFQSLQKIGIRISNFQGQNQQKSIQVEKIDKDQGNQIQEIVGLVGKENDEFKQQISEFKQQISELKQEISESKPIEDSKQQIDKFIEVKPASSTKQQKYVVYCNINSQIEDYTFLVTALYHWEKLKPTIAPTQIKDPKEIMQKAVKTVKKEKEDKKNQPVEIKIVQEKKKELQPSEENKIQVIAEEQKDKPDEQLVVQPEIIEPKEHQQNQEQQVLQEPAEPQPLQEPAEPQPLQEPAEPQLLQEPAEPQLLQEPAEPQLLQEPAEPQPLQEPAEPQPLQEPAEPQLLQEPAEPQQPQQIQLIDIIPPEPINLLEYLIQHEHLQEQQAQQEPASQEVPEQPLVAELLPNLQQLQEEAKLEEAKIPEAIPEQIIQEVLPPEIIEIKPEAKENEESEVSKPEQALDPQILQKSFKLRQQYKENLAKIDSLQKQIINIQQNKDLIKLIEQKNRMMCDQFIKGLIQKDPLFLKDIQSSLQGIDQEEQQKLQQFAQMMGVPKNKIQNLIKESVGKMGSVSMKQALKPNQKIGTQLKSAILGINNQTYEINIVPNQILIPQKQLEGLTSPSQPNQSPLHSLNSKLTINQLQTAFVEIMKVTLETIYDDDSQEEQMRKLNSKNFNERIMQHLFQAMCLSSQLHSRYSLPVTEPMDQEEAETLAKILTQAYKEEIEAVPINPYFKEDMLNKKLQEGKKLSSYFPFTLKNILSGIKQPELPPGHAPPVVVCQKKMIVSLVSENISRELEKVLETRSQNLKILEKNPSDGFRLNIAKSNNVKRQGASVTSCILSLVSFIRDVFTMSSGNERVVLDEQNDFDTSSQISGVTGKSRGQGQAQEKNFLAQQMIRNIFRSQRQEEIISLINDSLELLKSKKWPEISYQDRQVMLGLFAVIGGWYGFTRIIPGTKVQVQISNRWINASIIEDGQGKGKVSVILDDDFQLKLERVDHDKVKSLEPSLDNAISTKLNFDLLCEAITHVHQQIKGQQKESSTQKISIDDALISETVLFQMLLKVCSKLDWVNINQRSSANFTRFREILIQVTSVNVDCETHEDKTQEYLEKQLIEAWENVIDRDEQRNLSFYSPKEFNGADLNKNTIFVDLNQNYPSKSQGLVQEKLVQFSFGGSNTSSIYIDNDFVQPSSSYLKGLPEPVLKKNQKEAALKLLFYWEKYVLPTTREFVRSTFQKWEMNYYFEQLRHHLRQGDQRSAMNDAMTLWENKIPGGVILPHENTDWTAKVADECIVDSWVLAKLTSSRQTPSQKPSSSQSLSKSSKNQSQQKMPEQSVPLIIRLIDQGIQAIVIQIKLVDSRYNCVLGEFYDLENLSSHLVWFPISHLYELDYPLPPRSVGYSRKSVALSYLQSLENINQLYARKTLIKFFQSSYNQQISLENENQIAIVQKQNKVQFKWSELFGELKLHELISWSVQEEFSSSPFYGWLQDLNCALPIPVKANDKPNNTSGSTLQENQKVSDSIYLQKIIDETSDKIIIEKLLSREGSAQKEQVSKNNSQVSSSLSLIRNLLQNVVQGLTKEALTDSNEAYNTLNELTNWIYLNWMQMSQQVAQNRAVFDLCKYKENSNKKDKKDSGQTSTQNNTLIALHQVVSQNQKQISTKDDRTDQSIATLIMFHKVGCQLTPCSKVQFYSDSNQVNLVSEINAGTEAKTVLPPLVFNHGQIWANVVPGSLALLSKEQQNETSSSLPCAVFQIPKQWTVVCWLTETLSTSLLDLSTNQNQEVIVIVQEIYKKLIGAIVLFYQDSASPQIIKSQVIQLLMRLIRKLRFLYRQPSNNALNCLQTSDQNYSKLQHFTLLGITPAFIKTVLNDLDTFKKDEEKLAMASGSNYESQLLYSSFIQDAVELLMTIAVPFESCSIKNQELQIPRLNSYQDILEIKEPYLADLKKWIDPLLKTSMFMHYFNGEITSLPLDLLEEIHQQTTLGSYKAMDHILIVDKVVQDEENWPKTWIREQVISLCKKHHARVLNPNQDIIFNEGEYFVENKTEGSTLAEQTIQKCYTIIILLDGWNHMHPLPYSQNIFGDAVTEAKENKACFIDFKKIDSKSYRNFVQLFDSDSEVEEDVQDVDVEKLEREKKRAEEEAKFNAEIEALKPTEWSCETCTFMNQMTDSTCQICYQGKRPTMDKIMQEIRTQKEEERRQKKEADQAQNLQVDGIDSGKGIQKEEVEEFDENLTRLKFLSYDLVRFIKAEQKRKISEKKENKILKEILQPANDSDWEVNEAVQPENESQESNPIRKIDDQPVSDDYHEEFEIEMMPELPELGQKEDEDPRIKKLIELGIDLSMLEQDPQLVQVILESANLAEQQAREEEQKKKEAEEENLKREKLEKEKQEIKQKQGEEIKIHYHKTEVAFGVIQIKKAKDQAIRALFSSLTLRVANQEGEFTERAKKVLRNIYENLQAINSSSKIESLGEKNKNQILFGLDGNEIESLNDYGLSYESLKTQEYEEFESCCSVLLAADILLLFKLIAAQGYDFWLQQKTMSWTALNGNSTHDDIQILDKGLIEKLKTFVEIDYCDEKKVISQLTPYQFRILSKMSEDLNIDQQEIKPIGYFDDSILAVNASKQQQHHWLNSVSQAQLSFGWALVKTFSKYFAITVPFINCSVSIADTPQRGAIPITLSAYMSSLRNLCLSNTKYELKHLILQKTSYEREKTPSLLFERLKLHANSDQLAIQMKQEKKKSQNEGSAEQQDMLLNQQQVKTAQQIEQNETKQQNKNFMFTQAYEQLKDIDLWMLRPSEPRGSAPHLSFEVFFKGEDVVGMGGPYRQFFSDVALELQMVEQAERNENEEDGGREEDNNAAANEQNEENKSNEQSRQHLGLLCQSRNMLRKSQKGKDNFTISPSKNKLNHLSLFNFLGLLMGVCIRTNTNLSINLPSLVWKQLVGQRLTSDDIEQFDDAIQSELNEILLVSSAEEFEYTFTERYFTTILSDGTEVELCENGARKLLTFQNREEFARSLIYTRLKECEVQCEAIKRGICQIIPEALLNMVSYQELEEWIYGKKEVDVLLLQRHTEYGTGFTEESKEVKWFWEILFELSMEQLRKLVLFSYAQKTIPPNDEEFDRRQVRFMIRPYQGEKEKKKQNQEQIDRRLPRADTCFFNFELPNYSSKEVMKRQILFAITFDNVSLNAEQEDMQFHPNDNQSNGGFDNY